MHHGCLNDRWYMPCELRHFGDRASRDQIAGPPGCSAMSTLSLERTQRAVAMDKKACWGILRVLFHLICTLASAGSESLDFVHHTIHYVDGTVLELLLSTIHANQCSLAIGPFYATLPVLFTSLVYFLLIIEFFCLVV